MKKTVYSRRLTGRTLFIKEIGLDEDTWLRARGWALWKATFELCQIEDKNSQTSRLQKIIILNVLKEF